MYKSDVITHFKKPKHVARALGISRAAVYQWPDLIPEVSALKLERITGGALEFRPELYERRDRASVPAVAASAP